MEVLLLLFLLEPALAFHGQCAILKSDINVLDVYAWHFQLQRDAVLVLINVYCGDKVSRVHQLFLLCSRKVLGVEQTVEHVLEAADIAEGVKTVDDGHDISSK